MSCVIHGYVEDVEQEQLARNLVYLDQNEIVLGEPVKNITPRLLAVLTAIRSPFIVGGPIKPAHVGQFVWALHRDYGLRFGWLRREMLKKRLSAFSLEESFRAISAFIDLTFMDAPRGGKEEKPIASNIAWLIYRFRHSPWNMKESESANTPIRKLYQELRCFERENGEVPQNKSDQKKTEWLNGLNEALRTGKITQEQLDKWNADNRVIKEKRN